MAELNAALCLVTKANKVVLNILFWRMRIELTTVASHRHTPAPRHHDDLKNILFLHNVQIIVNTKRSVCKYTLQAKINVHSKNKNIKLCEINSCFAKRTKSFAIIRYGIISGITIYCTVGNFSRLQLFFSYYFCI